MSEEASVLVTIEDSVATMTLNNPTRKNAITSDMASRIKDFCDQVASDDSIGAAIIAARGDYFCSGADTRDLAVSSADPASTAAVERTSAVYDAFVAVGELPVPTVAVVSGGAVGAGLNLALAADAMLVTPDAILDSGFLARRIHPGGGHLSLLGRALSRPDAFVMGVFGVALTGDEAARRGLAWSAMPSADLMPRARLMTQLPSRDPLLARRVKRSARLELGPQAVGWEAALELERGVQMWSLGRKGEAGWDRKPGSPAREGA